MPHEEIETDPEELAKNWECDVCHWRGVGGDIIIRQKKKYGKRVGQPFSICPNCNAPGEAHLHKIPGGLS